MILFFLVHRQHVGSVVNIDAEILNQWKKTCNIKEIKGTETETQLFMIFMICYSVNCKHTKDHSFVTQKIHLQRVLINGS